eukprot:COSAG02_NODE_5824_length_4012_cov_59.380199_6_plen_121_part_00
MTQVFSSHTNGGGSGDSFGITPMSQSLAGMIDLEEEVAVAPAKKAISNDRIATTPPLKALCCGSGSSIWLAGSNDPHPGQLSSSARGIDTNASHYGSGSSPRRAPPPRGVHGIPRGSSVL